MLWIWNSFCTILVIISNKSFHGQNELLIFIYKILYFSMVKVQPKSHSNELTVTIWWFLICNNVHNILRLCHAEQISSFYYNWNEAWLSVITGIYDLPHEFANDVRFRILINYKITGENQNFTKLLPNAQSVSRNETFVSTSKNLLKNRNKPFPVVCYFTWKLKFVSNIL